MVLPLLFFAYSSSRVLQQSAEAQAVTESTQIARISAALVEEHFRQSIEFLQSITGRPSLRKAWHVRNFDFVEAQLAKASASRSDFSFVSLFDLDGTMRAINPPRPALGRSEFRVPRLVQRRGWTMEALRLRGLSDCRTPRRNGGGVCSSPDGTTPASRLEFSWRPRASTRSVRRLVETNLDGAWTISLVDQNGHLSARPNIDPQAQRIELGSYEPVKQLLGGSTGNGMFVRAGNTFFTHYEPIRGYGWGATHRKAGGRLAARHVGRSTAGVDSRDATSVRRLGLGLLHGLAVFPDWKPAADFSICRSTCFVLPGSMDFSRTLNPSFEKTLGFTTKELMAKPYLEFIHPDDRPATVVEKDGLQARKSHFCI